MQGMLNCQWYSNLFVHIYVEINEYFKKYGWQWNIFLCYSYFFLIIKLPNKSYTNDVSAWSNSVKFILRIFCISAVTIVYHREIAKADISFSFSVIIFDRYADSRAWKPKTPIHVSRVFVSTFSTSCWSIKHVAY